ncbi:MAG: hypothetical protein WDN02_05200 [Methylovirgula sp.]|uniref:hypothetical protein n=1 Tax=Methylovirgula sp. TaxID=1978224 RepID=UPI0030768394
MTHTPEQIAQATKDLQRTPSLVHDLADEAARIENIARHNSPNWRALDGELQLALGRAGNAAPAIGVLMLRAAIDHFSVRAAEEAAAREAEGTAAHKRADDARLAVQREGVRVAWAERVSKETLSAVSRLAERIQRARERLGAISNEVQLREVLGDIADAATSINATIALESRASIDREAAEAQRCAA